MSEHPSSLDLEAFACGEPIARVRDHVGACAECRAFVDRLGAGRVDDVEAMVSAAEERAARVVSIRSAGSARAPLRRARPLLYALPLVAAAAGFAVWARLPPPAAPSNSAAPAILAAADPTGEPETTFKGGVQLAVVRERAGAQARFTSAVSVAPGDRLRIEVALDRNATILAGVLAEDGTFLMTMATGDRGAGTHFAEQAARFDADPTRGWLLAGPPDAIARARAAKRPVGGVIAMRLEWEAR